MVVKEQEVADAAEEVALQRAGALYTPTETLPRDWEQIVGYAAPGSATVETRLSPLWLHRLAEAPAATFAVDASTSLWQQTGSSGWIQVSTGQIRANADPSWPQFPVIAGETYVDPVNGRYLIPTLVWLDHTTGDVSAVGPGSGEFVGAAPAGNSYPDGLSDLIATPQEYVTALLKVSTGMLAGADLVAMKAAIESFERAGPWEDVRQPYFAKDSLGNVALGVDGRPIANPLRVVDVAFRGELNDYYRQLVRDHGISPATARTAGQFEIIGWTLVTGMSSADARRFVSAHTESVRVYKAAFYNEAMESDALYFRYCRMFIAWMTINRMVSERMQGIGDVDRMSSYDLTNLLYSYGVYQFDDMPVVYRRRLAKNLEKILSVKGTTKVFKDILGIFNLNKDIKIWKHYLVRYYPNKDTVLRIPRPLADGEVLVATLESTAAVRAASMQSLADQLTEVQTFRAATVSADGLSIVLQRVEDAKGDVATLEIVEDASGGIVADGFIEIGDVDYGLPEVGFQKADIDDPTAETTIANMDTSYLADYNEFVSRDTTWETSRKDARELAFSVVQTKYFSMSSAVDAVHNGMALAVLWGMLKDAQARGRTGAMLIDGANTLDGVVNMNLFEGFVACMTLTLWRFGVDDLIPHGESGVSTIISARTDGSPFPNEGSLLPYSTVIERVADAPDPLYAQDVVSMMDRNIATAINIDKATNDTGRMDTVGGYDPLHGGEESRTVKRNFQLRSMWDYKFVSTYTTDAFGSSERYSDWLDRVNPELATWVRRMDATGDYVNAILQLVLLIEDAIDSKNLNLPIALGMNDIVMTYIERMVRFFKAYTTDLRSFSTYLLIDRPAVESLRLMNLLAGLKVTWSRDDTADQISDFFRTLSRWAVSEGKEGGLFLDVLGSLGSLKEQDIARLLDGLPSWYNFALRVSPAAKMRDAVAFKVKGSRREALTVSTRAQRPGDVVVVPVQDLYGLGHPTYSATGSAGTLFSPSLGTDPGATLQPAEIVREELNASSRPRPQGLGDGTLIIPNS
jgi:hypothetical protein